MALRVAANSTPIHNCKDTKKTEIACDFCWEKCTASSPLLTHDSRSQNRLVTVVVRFANPRFVWRCIGLISANSTIAWW